MVNVSELLLDSASAAHCLLGMKLVHDSDEGMTADYIVKAEAYFLDDLVSYAYKGWNSRNAAMLLGAGSACVYFIYGIHYCFNIVTGEKGKEAAGLIRFFEPIEGI